MKITAMDKRASQARMRAYSDALDSTDPRSRTWSSRRDEISFLTAFNQGGA